ncbi:MAG: AtpZ/AtpI family protein [Nitrospirae bacterium]|nr:AtpZ/AtpI family protein [Nitrospirota bacterium]
MVENSDNEKYRYVRQVGLYTGIPVLLVAGPAIGFFIGNYLDKKLGTDPWFMIFFIVVGFVASIRQTIEFITRASNRK